MSSLGPEQGHHPTPPPTPGPIPPPPAAPFPSGFPQGRAPRRRVSARTAFGLVLAIVLSAVVTATVTVVTMRRDAGVQPGGQPPAWPAPTSPSPTPQFSPAASAAAQSHLCQVFDTSVRGQKGQGGLRVEGNWNLPIILRGLNSASAVQNALAPALPAEIADAARKYISATLDQTTAAMSDTPTPEVNRLTDVRNAATDELTDACGLPR